MSSRMKSNEGGLVSLEDIPRIARVTLHGSVLSQLRDMIIEGKLGPGARLNETQLGLVLGVSRTPLREAIKSLAGEGLIEIRPARGAIVRQFSADDVRHILEVITILEQGAGRILCARGSAQDMAEMEALHNAMLAEYAKRDRLSCFKLSQEFHSSLVRRAHNPVLIEAHQLLQARIKRARFVGNETPDGWQDSVNEHQAMLDALLERDADKLAAKIGEHLSHTMKRVHSCLSLA